MYTRYISVSITMLFLYFNSWSQSAWQEHYKIYDIKSKKTISVDELVQSAETTDVLFFGEEHNDSIAHRLQDTLYQLLLNRYKTFTLSLEMFERDCQQVLNEYLDDFITDDRLVKEGRAWGNYKDYRPVVNTAKLRRQKVIAANAPRRYVNMISRRGLASLDSLSKKAKQYFARLPIDTVNTPYFEKFSKVMGDNFTNRNIYYAQTMWDATMAESIYHNWKKTKRIKIFHLNGRFHTDYHLGTISQLQRKNKKLIIRNISCFPAPDFEEPDWTKYELLGDYIIVTNPHISKSF